MPTIAMTWIKWTFKFSLLRSLEKQNDTFGVQIGKTEKTWPKSLTTIKCIISTTKNGASGVLFDGLLSCVHFQLCTNTMMTPSFATSFHFIVIFGVYVSSLPILQMYQIKLYSILKLDSSDFLGYILLDFSCNFYLFLYGMKKTTSPFHILILVQ